MSVPLILDLVQNKIMTDKVVLYQRNRTAIPIFFVPVGVEFVSTVDKRKALS